MPPTPGTLDPSTGASDAELCRDLAEQGARALGPIYDRYAGQVLGLARAILRDSDEAQDVVQEVFLVFQRRGRFDPGRGSLVAYLITMTRSLAIDRMRSKKRRATFVEELARDAPKDIDPVTPLDRLLENDDAVRVRAAMAALPEKHRVVLEMAYYKGMSQTEIATALAAPLGTVKTWSRMGILSLRDSLRSVMGQDG